MPAAETQESFVGSDFTYEDIGGREFDDYTYAFAGPDGENASWTPPAGGAPRPAWRLESRRKDSHRRVSARRLARAQGFLVVVAADVYNRRNEKQKVYTVRRLEQIEAIWTVMESEMTNALEKTRTELVVESTDYNVGLKEADFSRRELENVRPAQGRSSEPGRSPAGSTAGAFRSRSSSSLGALVQAPRANITEIDNDITAWFSKDDPVYGTTSGSGASSAALARSSSPSRPTRPIGCSPARRSRRSPRSPPTSSASTPSSRSTASPRPRSSRRIKSQTPDEGGLEVRPLLEDVATRDPAEIRRRALEDDLIRGDLVSEDGSTTAIIVSFDEDRIDEVRAGVIQQIHDIVDPKLPAGVRAYYNGSLEISETYNRITLDNQRKFTPPILLFTVLAIYLLVPLLAQDDARDVRDCRQRCSGRSASTR